MAGYQSMCIMLILGMAGANLFVFIVIALYQDSFFSASVGTPEAARYVDLLFGITFGDPNAGNGLTPLGYLLYALGFIAMWALARRGLVAGWVGTAALLAAGYLTIAGSGETLPAYYGQSTTWIFRVAVALLGLIGVREAVRLKERGLL